MTIQQSQETLAAQEQELTQQYQLFLDQKLKLDMTRGKPSNEQLELCQGLDQAFEHNYYLPDGTDLRNYGSLDGIPEARQLGALLLGVTAAETMAGGNSSLIMMYQYFLHAYLFGVRGVDTAWKSASPKPKFLCPVPGYDRHFAICQEFNVEMIPIPLNADGPDMDQIEALLKQDKSIKGMWCVPKYSNPTGHVYAPQVVKRIAELGKLATAEFRVFWDNAYCVHDLVPDAVPLLNIMDEAKKAQTQDTIVIFASTSKITYPGAGVAFMGASEENLQHFRKQLSVMTIGPDKVTQMKHVLYLKNLDDIHKLMAKHAQILKPKFDAVLNALETQLGAGGFGTWTTPKGGYFVSFDTLPGLAKSVVKLAADAGVKFTPAGATFPYGKDPEDKNIRIAPTMPPLQEVIKAMAVFTLCVKLASLRKLLK